MIHKYSTIIQSTKKIIAKKYEENMEIDCVIDD